MTTQDVPAQPSPGLRTAHDLLIGAAATSDLDRVEAALDAIVAVLESADDPSTDLEALDGVVTGQLDALARTWRAEVAEAPEPDDGDRPAPPTPAMWDARLYAAAMEDLYLAVEADFLAADLHLERGRMMLEQGYPAEAEPLLREAVDLFADDPEYHAGWPWQLLGIALREQDRPLEAVAAFEQAADLSIRWDRQASAALALDELASMLQDEDRERAVSLFDDAAGRYRRVGDDEGARSCEISLAATAIQIAVKEWDGADVEPRERWSRRAWEIGTRLGEDELASFAALCLGASLGGRGESADALALLAPTVEVFDREGCEEQSALAMTLIASLHNLLGDQVKADLVGRRALARAQALGDNDLVSPLLGMLGALAETRFDAAASRALFERAGRRLGDSDPDPDPWMQDRQRSLALLGSGDIYEAIPLLQAMADRTAGIANQGDQASYALGLLLTLAAARGDAEAVDRCLAQLEATFRAESASGDPFTARGMELVMPAYRAMAAAAHGDLVTYQRLLEQVHDRLMDTGAGYLAVRSQFMMAAADLTRGRPEDALSRMVPALPVLLAQVTTLPSSAEREALRGQLRSGLEMTLRTAADVRDPRLLCELQQVVQSQGMPTAGDGGPDDVAPSIAGLLSGMPGMVGDVVTATGIPGTEAAHLRGRDWAEQETSVEVPPRVVMPWGCAALARYHEQSVRYAPVLAGAPLVRLEIPR